MHENSNINTAYSINGLENQAMQISPNLKYTKHITVHYKYFLSQNSISMSNKPIS